MSGVLKKLKIEWLVLIVLTGCSSTPVHQGEPPPQANLLPPDFQIESQEDLESFDYYILQSLTSAKSRNQKWWLSYKRAQIWEDTKPTISCENYAELAKDPLFPLAQVAYLKAFQYCPAGSQALVQFTQLNLESLPNWLENLGLASAIARAELDSNFDQLMSLAYEKSKQFLPKNEKIEWTEKAKKLAQVEGKQKFAEKMEKRLSMLSPARIKNPNRSEWLKVAYDHRRRRQFQSAVKYYEKVIHDRKTSFSQKLSAHRGLARAYKNKREMEVYLKQNLRTALFVEKHYRKSPNQLTRKRLFHDNFVTLARAQWTQGQVKKARRTLAIVEKVLRNRFSMAEIFWLFGRMDEEKKKYERAKYWFERALKEPIRNKEFREKIEWYLAWNQRKTQDMTAASLSFENLREQTDSDFARSRFHFWLAKTYLDNDQKTEAMLEFQALIKKDPLGYYGLLAHHFTDQEIPASDTQVVLQPQDQKATRKAKREMKSLADLQMLEWLISLEERDLAKRYLNTISKKYRNRENQSELTWLEIFHYYGKAGEYLSLFEQLGKLTAERRQYVLDRDPTLIFPRPFSGIVQSSAEKTGISPALIYSIMRQESAFNPRARSFADAYGLLQMLPENAKKEPVAQYLNYQKPEDLYRPEVNIPIGAAFLQKLKQKWEDQFILMVASYNANDRAIRGWIRTRYRGDTVEFIEDIPYEETRGYIRLVMRNLIFYKLLAAEGEKIEFPRQLLQLNLPGRNSKTGRLKEAKSDFSPDEDSKKSL